MKNKIQFCQGVIVTLSFVLVVFLSFAYLPDMVRAAGGSFDPANIVYDDGSGAVPMTSEDPAESPAPSEEPEASSEPTATPEPTPDPAELETEAVESATSSVRTLAEEFRETVKDTDDADDLATLLEGFENDLADYSDITSENPLAEEKTLEDFETILVSARNDVDDARKRLENIQANPVGTRSATVENISVKDVNGDFVDVPTAMKVTTIIGYDEFGEPMKEYVYMEFGTPRNDDGKTLYSISIPYVGIKNVFGDGDGSSFKGNAFPGTREAVRSRAIFTPGKITRNGVTVHQNVLIDGSQVDSYFVKGAETGTWNYRPFFNLASNDSYRTWSAEDWLNQEAEEGADFNNMAIYGVYVVQEQGEIVDIDEIKDSLDYITLFEGAKPFFN